MGIEPTSEAWEASILPLNYTRNRGSLNILENHIISMEKMLSSDYNYTSGKQVNQVNNVESVVPLRETTKPGVHVPGLTTMVELAQEF